MAQPVPIPANLFAPLPAGESLVDQIGPEDLVYFLCNVGDGDAQLLLLPEQTATTGPPMRRAIIVDSSSPTKIPRLIRDAARRRAAPGRAGGSDAADRQGRSRSSSQRTRTDDHIGGMSQLLDRLLRRDRRAVGARLLPHGPRLHRDDERDREPAVAPLRAADERASPLDRQRRGDRADSVDPAAQPVRHVRRRGQQLVDRASHRVPGDARGATRGRPEPRRHAEHEVAHPGRRRADAVLVVCRHRLPRAGGLEQPRRRRRSRPQPAPTRSGARC